MRTRSFFGFFFIFVAIIGAAFLVLAWAGVVAPSPVDNIAQPQ